jgi:hypothetical protein
MDACLNMVGNGGRQGCGTHKRTNDKQQPCANNGYFVAAGKQPTRTEVRGTVLFYKSCNARVLLHCVEGEWSRLHAG